MTDAIEGVTDPQPEIQKVTDAPVLPEKTEPETDAEKQIESIKREKDELVQKFEKAEKERLATEQRLTETQAYISRTRNLEKEKETSTASLGPTKTFDDYLGDIDKMVDSDFENDPKAGLKKIARKIVTDVAFDRDLERQQHQKDVKEAEERAFRRAVGMDKEKSKLLGEVEKLDTERPDLKNLTFDQKMEFIGMRDGKVEKENGRQQLDREREMASGVGAPRVAARSDRTPAWTKDPAVLREAQGHFKSVEEMMNWADPDKAREMGNRMRTRSA